MVAYEPKRFNKIGRCTDGYWGEEDSGSPSLDKPIKSEDGECGGENSTEACCGRFGHREERRAACLEDFKCTNDPCKVSAAAASSGKTSGAPANTLKGDVCALSFLREVWSQHETLYR